MNEDKSNDWIDECEMDADGDWPDGLPRNPHDIHSQMIEAFEGIKDDTFMSVGCLLGSQTEADLAVSLMFRRGTTNSQMAAAVNSVLKPVGLMVSPSDFHPADGQTQAGHGGVLARHTILCVSLPTPSSPRRWTALVAAQASKSCRNAKKALAAGLGYQPADPSGLLNYSCRKTPPRKLPAFGDYGLASQ